ncbi:hypothetical protein LTR37_009588 [Vermiconidia calcicola]|uniref:Uncharacterized protein n=1 Tax=Vermiconidia calcicola TaxID=1690605 RepID=A0ACC3N896_9PEZI|nr:hypothetical protein LTR37_009588 [Vermiconidia calcicola]
MARKASEEGQHDEKSLSSVNREHAATIEEEGLALGFDAAETSKLLRKVDYRLIPVLAFLYLLAFLDRSNLGNAKVAGLEEDLQLTGTQYNLAATVFFFPYCLLEIPANVMLKLLRPSRWIGCLVIAWGTVTTCTGSIESYHGLIISRGIFYCAASLAGAFSGLLAFAISKMDGVANLAGWRWIFILEGAVTVLTGFAVLWLLPDSPETSKWLDDREKKFIRARLDQDSGTREGRVNTTDEFQLKYLIAAVTDWKLWFTVFIYWGST